MLFGYLLQDFSLFLGDTKYFSIHKGRQKIQNDGKLETIIFISYAFIILLRNNSADFSQNKVQ